MPRYSHSQHSRGSARAGILVSVAAAFGLFGFAGGAQAQTLYWDVNGANPGATDGTTASGEWDPFPGQSWSADPSGSSPTTRFVDGSAVVFSAGSNATGSSVINVGREVRTTGFTVEEGSISLSGFGRVDNGTSPALIMPGATLSTGGHFSRSGTLTIDGGTLRNPDWPAAVQLTANGGTFDTDTQSGSGYDLSRPITLAPGTPAATLTKTGPGRFNMLSSADFTTLNVNQGVYVASTDRGFGAANGTVNVADGAVVGITSAGFVSPATRTFVLAGKGTFGGHSGYWTINSAITGPGGFVLDEIPPFGTYPGVTLAGTNTFQGATTINDGVLTVAGGNAIPDGSRLVFGEPNSSGKLELRDNETVASISGGDFFTRVELAIGTDGKTLTAGGDNTSTRFAGSFSLYNGGFTKVGTGKLTLAGTSSSSVGTLTVKEGTVELNSSSPVSVVHAIIGGDNSGATAVVSTVGLSRFSADLLTVDGPNASFVMGGNQTSHIVELKNGARITGAANAILRGVQSFNLESGTVDVILATARSDGVGGTLNKTTAGTVTLNGLNTYTGGTNVADGTLRVKRLQANNAVNITGGKLQVMDSAPSLPAHPSGDNAFVSRPSALAIANDGAPLGARVYAGQLDLTNNDLVLDYAPDGPNPAAEIEDMVRAGYASGTWAGNGIASSTADANRNFAIGVADNAKLAIPYGDGTTGRLFSGQAVDATTVLVKFTHRIDLDLDGVITTNDATIFNSNYREGVPAYWSIGDLDYDRVFTTNDATIFNSFYNESLASVPEPGAVCLLSSVALAFVGRRRRCAG